VYDVPDLEGLAANLHRDWPPPRVGSRVPDHDGLRRWWDDFVGAFPDYAVEIEEPRNLGEVTLSHVRGWGHGAESATPLVDPFWLPVRWRDGKAVWWRNCSTEQEALEAVRSPE
jgi:hypothetical protein